MNEVDMMIREELVILHSSRMRHTTRTKRLYRQLMMFCAVATIVAGCGSTSAISVHSRPHLNAPPGTPTQALKLPDSYTSVHALGSTGTGGLWVWSSTQNESHVWFRDADGTVADWSVGVSPDVVHPFSPPQIATCGNDAWLGINHELIPLDPATGPGKPLMLQTPVNVPAVDSHRPPQLRGVWSVDALACDGAIIAVGESDADSALLINTTTQNSTRVPLPLAGEVENVAINDEGIVAFGLQDYNGQGPHVVVLAGGTLGSPENVTVRDSQEVISVGNRFIAGIPGEVITANAGEKAAVSASPVTLPSRFARSGGSVSLVSGEVAVAGFNGIAVIDPRGSSPSRVVTTGEVPCPRGVPDTPHSPSSSPTVPPTTLPPNSKCPVGVVMMVSDSRGGVMFVPNSAQNTVELISTAP